MKIDCICINDECSDGFRCFRPNGLAEWNLFVLFKCSTYVYQDDDYILAEPGTYCIFKKGAHTEYYPKEKIFIHDYFHFEFDKKSESRYFENLNFGKVTGIRNRNEIEKILKMMKQEADFDTLRTSSALSELTKYFFIKLAENYVDGQESERESTRYINFMILRKKMIKNPEKRWNIAELASNMYISESYFQHFYKDLFGISFYSDVINARISKAKNILLYSGYSVLEISQMCGYENVEHFIRQFKKNVGVTPNKYRSIMIQK